MVLGIGIDTLERAAIRRVTITHTRSQKNWSRNGIGPVDILVSLRFSVIWSTLPIDSSASQYRFQYKGGCAHL
ncbi:MAG: hypothetical protein CM1200mP24_01880 [Gammaproteobacteria bacterium]|nr:MAG: hypothetical protein CM1200mP24_01880 [Gammaproteobacteria bacterium]